MSHRERRYTEIEVADIFEQATKVLPAATGGAFSGDGMTLAELQDIGREIGISAGSVARAAQNVGRDSRPASRTFMGLPLGVERTIYLPRPLTDSEWERLVVDLRETFGARGTLSGQGSLRQWTNGNLQALLEPTATGYRIRLRTIKGDAASLLTMGLAMFGLSSTGLIAAISQGATGDLGMIMALSVVGVVGSIIAAATALRLPRWARTRQQQMNEIAARTALEDDA